VNGGVRPHYGGYMAYEKILILESTWASDADDYIRDSRSTARIYLSFESLLSLHDKPVFAVHRPLLARRYVQDVRQFVGLPANRQGPNVIILSAHGSFQQIEKGARRVNRRRLNAIDGEVKLSKDIHSLNGVLARTLFILDACDVGTHLDTFRRAAGALGAIGFCRSVDWVDSAAFILALLLRLQSEGIFHLQRARVERLRGVIESMCAGAYKSLARELGVEKSFAA
jgi:hypothetical protein